MMKANSSTNANLCRNFADNRRPCLPRRTTAIALCLACGVALADDHGGEPAKACTSTANDAFVACQHDVLDNFWIANGNCVNLAAADARATCRQDAKATAKDERSDCGEQRAARRDACEALGEAPYDPAIDPAMFVDPAQIGQSIAPNPYFPLIRGRVWVYQGGTETNTVTVTVTADTRTILGVTCAVVHDVVEDDGEVTEDTKDWYAQDVFGNVWYFGEISQTLEDGELVDIEGSWTAGVESAKAGIVMKAVPAIGDVYRQEFSLGNAEDIAEVTSLTGMASVPAASCADDCLVTREFTPLEPDLFEFKYYAPGVGPILIQDPDAGADEELVQVIN